MHVAEQGEGPLVLLCHGFPESWYTWRHQLPALAEAGFREVAPDMRGYGRTDRPEPIDQYTLYHLVGDMVGLLDALGAAQAVIAGHDWGAPVAWHAAALMRPDRFRGVIGLKRAVSAARAGPADEPDAANRGCRLLPALFPDPGGSRSRIRARCPQFFIRGSLYSISGDMPRSEPTAMMVPRQGGLQARWASEFANPSSLPSWLTEADVDFYAGEFAGVVSDCETSAPTGAVPTGALEPRRCDNLNREIG
jgi:pimeloyl-ACP methyl ester carboxylesterase